MTEQELVNEIIDYYRASQDDSWMKESVFLLAKYGRESWEAGYKEGCEDTTYDYNQAQ